jgi:hypothetical protein
MRPVSMLVGIALLAAGAAQAAEVPTVMNYQGRLTDNTPEQAPIDTGLPMVFRIFDAASGGVEQWSESWPSVSVVQGIFSVLLGSNGVPLPPSVFGGGADRYLQIEVDGEVLLPRQQLGSAAYASKAESAADAARLGGVAAASWQRRVGGTCPSGASIRSIDAAGGVVCETDDAGLSAETDPKVGVLAAGRYPRWGGSSLINGDLYASAGNVGVFTSNPQEDFHVFRDDADVARIYATGAGQGAGMLFAGESADYGGGIAYDGDEQPNIVGDLDRVTLFRRSGGLDTDVLSFSTTSNDVRMSGSLNVATGWVGTHPSYGPGYLGLWRNGLDYTLLGNDNVTQLNAPNASGNIQLRVGNVIKMRVDGSTGTVSIPGTLDVDGTARLGLQTVLASYPLGQAMPCPLYGGGTCYTGSGCATCPAGSEVIGGGCSGGSPGYSSIASSHPNGESWCCESSYDIAGKVDTAYAVCARIGF